MSSMDLLMSSAAPPRPILGVNENGRIAVLLWLWGKFPRQVKRSIFTHMQEQGFGFHNCTCTACTTCTWILMELQPSSTQSGSIESAKALRRRALLKLANNQSKTNFPFFFLQPKMVVRKKCFTFFFCPQNWVWSPKTIINLPSGGHMVYLWVFAWCHSIIFALIFQ